MVEFQNLQFGNFVIDRSRQVLRVGDRDVALRPQSFDVLCYLAERAGTVVSKDRLIQAIWKRRPASDDSLMQCIKDIRQALGEGGHATIKTVAKRGYLFAAEITSAPSSSKVPLALPPSRDTATDCAPERPDFGRWILTGVMTLSVILASALALSGDQPSFETETMTLMAAPSIAILPFTQTNDATSQSNAFNSLATNIATELTATWRGYRIQVKAIDPGDSDKGPIALRRLGTRYAVMGVVHGAAEKARINVQMVEARSNQLVWGQIFADAPTEPDAPTLLATRIAQLISMQLLTAESHRPLSATPSAEDFAMLGRARLVGERGAKANHQAGALFEKGLALDPNSITALLGLSRTHLDDVLNGWASTAARRTLLDRSEAMIQRIIELEPRSREGHLQRGVLARARKDIDQAIAAFEHTLELSPRYPHAHAELGRALIELGQAEDAIVHIGDAIRLSPTDNALYIWCLWAGMAAVHAGNYEAALGWLRRSRQANHAFDSTLFWLAVAHAGLGQTQDAQPFLAAFLASRPRFNIASWSLGPPYRNEIVAQQRTRIAELMVGLGIKQYDAEALSSRTSLQQ